MAASKLFVVLSTLFYASGAGRFGSRGPRAELVAEPWSEEPTWSDRGANTSCKGAGEEFVGRVNLVSDEASCMRLCAGWDVSCTGFEYKSTTECNLWATPIVKTSFALGSHCVEKVATGKNSVVSMCLEPLSRFLEGLRGTFPEIPHDGENTALVEGGTPFSGVIFLALALQAEIAGLPASAPVTVCETGFNYGISDLAFLCSSSRTRVVSWDIGEHHYTAKAGELIAEAFPGRHRLTIGDSTKTVLTAGEAEGPLAGGLECDIVFVDGGHDPHVAFADIKNFKAFAKPGALLIVDDCHWNHGEIDTCQKAGSLFGGPYNSFLSVNDAYSMAVSEGLVRREPSKEWVELASPQQSVCVARY